MKLNYPKKRAITPGIVLLLLLFSIPFSSLHSQVDEDQLGAWYMYFWNSRIKQSNWGIQGDYQLRNWNVAGDLEQILLRTGLTYTPPKTKVKFTAGYGWIATGTPGDATTLVKENRIYQEALIPHRVGNRFYLTHRFRFEQRFVHGQDFRTRGRYNLFLNVPFNRKDLKQGAVYLALYHELFMNGQRDIGDGRTVEIFDRNRAYMAIGYSIFDNLRVQVGYMQQTTDNWSKGQLQLSLHHKFQLGKDNPATL